MIWTTKLAILALSAAGLSGGGVLLATADTHPVVNVEQMERVAVAGPQHDLVPMQAVEGLEYDSGGGIVSARIDGLEAPASAPASAHDATPIS